MTAVDQAERLLQQKGHVHLLGIGGVGMAGLALLLKARGLKVSGCDLQKNRQTAHLKECGIPIFIPHHINHLTPETTWVIRSTAIPKSHPEILSAQKQGLPISRRGEVLAALMRDRTCIAVAGTHGKTTTTAMIAQILNCGYFVGGEIVGTKGVAKESKIMVIEADESDGTLVGYTPDFSIITNIEYDHMEHHSSEAAFLSCFEQLIKNTKKKVFYCADDPLASKLCAPFTKCEPFSLPARPFLLPLPGQHNQWNAAATQAICKIWISEEKIQNALKKIHPIRRRFETLIKQNGIQIISDYAHHPTEISALIQTAKSLQPRRILILFQPHRYTRTRALGSNFPAAFEGVDQLWLVPVYPASESPIDGGKTKDLLAHFPDSQKEKITLAPSLEEAWNDIKKHLSPTGDLLLIAGAGDVEKVGDWAKKHFAV